ncbi:helix-turn-helix domain-containing protein [Candidatus Avoscillospira sp. LCP25S3_F1]|uniref:helix-turn-helix domain-containing protein n=1 Tax=Candidatus Avoscillospira sp. LCP25S3_F1 TaxID=3438825 RepID=UPI003F8F444C
MSYFDTIYADERLPHRARAVYMYLRDRCGRKENCWPGIRTIAADLHLSRSTVKRALNDLERHGYLRRDPRYRDNGGRTSNLYTVQ